MKLYNTLTRQIEEFTPLQDNAVGIYTCGPTVYNHSTIGNLSSFIFADTLARTLRVSGYDVKHVMNLTDVDDKTIKKGHETYPHDEPMAALKQLTEQYGQIFLEDIRTIGNAVDFVTFTKATEYIPQMQQLIERLMSEGFAYAADDGIYFSIEKYRQSGKVYGQLSEITENSTSTARVNNDEYDKESAHDFALWKAEKAGEPAWDFHMGGKNYRGRPGWHIECSVMSTASLGQPFDIHTGGVDLIFPHHENEIAQSTAGQDKPYAAFFAHNEHLLVDGQKMSKSLNNFYTLEDIKQKGFDPLSFRLLVLQAHYRTQAHFSWDNLQAAQNRLQGFREIADLRWQSIEDNSDASLYDEAYQGLIDDMQNDLDTPRALTRLNAFADKLKDSLVSIHHLKQFDELMAKIDGLLGLDLSTRKDITAEQKTLITQRQQARDSEDWAKADQFRDQLAEQRIAVRDTIYGPIWYRV
jgi:cysteinyl-tRNA synthetase